MKKFIRFVRALSNLRSKSAWRNFVALSEVTLFDDRVSVSWSQAGEDIALLSVIHNLECGSYIDIGAHHPSRFSVTRHLYQIGWRGVNVEPNPKLSAAFISKRPEDTNICAAVGFEKEFKLTIFGESAISTVSQMWRKKFIEEGWSVKDEIIVPGITLRAIYDDFFTGTHVNLLTIDAEGSDLEVLQSLALETLSKSRYPKWIFLEAAPPVSNALEAPAVKFAIEWGYEPHIVLPMSTLLKLKE